MSDYFIEDEVKKRVEELAKRSAHRQDTVFTRFLTPPQQQYALAFGKKQGCKVLDFGGFVEAERRMVAFSWEKEADERQFPIAAIEVSPKGKQGFTLGHRDVLGAFLATGLDRSYVGDVLLQEEKALIFVAAPSLLILLDQVGEIGRMPVGCQAVPLETIETLAPQGHRVQSSVASLRLDGVLAKALEQNREKVAVMVQKGLVKVNHLPAAKKDKILFQGDVISLRGYGRIEVEEIGSPNRKKRIPISLMCYGMKTIDF